MPSTKPDWDQLLLRSEELAQQVNYVVDQINRFSTINSKAY